MRRAAIQPAPGRAYRVRGRIPPGTTYFGLETIDRHGTVRATLHDRDLELDSEGRFEVSIEHGGIATGEETALIATQYFVDRTAQPPVVLAIERLGAPLPPASLTARMQENVARARLMVESVIRGTVESWRTMADAARNRFVDVPAFVLRPRDQYRYRMLWFRVPRGQSLVVRGRLGRARYFGITLHNAWMESLDGAHRNHATLRCDADGAFAVCIGDAPRGYENWLDCGGREQGYLTVRTLLPEEEPFPLHAELMAMENVDGTEERRPAPVS
jgi:hypothetical protein